MEEQQRLLNDLEARVSEVMEIMASRSIVEQENAKMRVAYYERLIILCGGTLALSFTAAINFHNRIDGPNGVEIRSLLMAWKLLLGGIIGCLISNFLALASAANEHYWLTHKFFDIASTRVVGALTRLNIDSSSASYVNPPEATAKAKAAERRALGFRNLSVSIGIIAQIAIFASFLYLYWFAKNSVFGK